MSTLERDLTTRMAAIEAKIDTTRSDLSKDITSQVGAATTRVVGWILVTVTVTVGTVIGAAFLA